MGAAGGTCSGGCNDKCADSRVAAYEWRVPSRPAPHELGPTDDMVWMQELLDPMGRMGEPYRAIAEDGINVRLGLELDTPVVRKVPEGALFNVFARQVNAQGIERLRTVEGWTSLRGASDGKLVAEPFTAHSPDNEAEDVVERCLVESKSAFRSARSSASRSVRFAEQIAETREVHVGESVCEDDDVSMGALIDSAAPWLFGSLTRTSTADGVGFLPELVQGKRVLVDLGNGRYVVDNSQLQAKAPRLGYRRSMGTDDRLPTPGPVWGSIVRGCLQDGWLETDLPRAMTNASLSSLLAARAATDSREAGAALTYASAQGTCTLVSALLESRADHGIRDASGRTPLMHASLAGHVDIVEALLLAGADYNLKDDDGYTATTLASRSAASKEAPDVGVPALRSKLGGA